MCCACPQSTHQARVRFCLSKPLCTALSPAPAGKKEGLADELLFPTRLHGRSCCLTISFQQDWGWPCPCMLILHQGAPVASPGNENRCSLALLLALNLSTRQALGMGPSTSFSLGHSARCCIPCLLEVFCLSEFQGVQVSMSVAVWCEAGVQADSFKFELRERLGAEGDTSFRSSVSVETGWCSQRTPWSSPGEGGCPPTSVGSCCCGGGFQTFLPQGPFLQILGTSVSRA